MDIRRVIRLRLRHQHGPIQVVGDINAVLAANVGEHGKTTSVSSRQRIVQRSGREDRPDAGEGDEGNQTRDQRGEEGGESRD